MSKLSLNDFATVCLMGGESRRFNYQNKALLPFNKDCNFYEQIQKQFKDYEFYFSTHTKIQDLKHPQIIDNCSKRIGPLGGINACFKSLKKEYIFFTSCDMPFISTELIDYFLMQTIKYPKKTLIAKVDDKLFPTFCLYHLSSKKEIQKAIDNQNYRLMDLLQHIDYQIIDLTNTVFSKQLININNMDIYKKHFKTPNILCISGFKNSGKTTLLSNLIPFFLKDNLKIAILKHDVHNLKLDNEQTDTMKFAKAGAKNITIFNDEEFAQIIKDKFCLNHYLKQLKDYDYILIEGLKDSDYPKIYLNTKEEKKALKNILFNVHKKETNLNKKNINWNDYSLIYQTIRKEFDE